jgi:hypothetical protein
VQADDSVADSFEHALHLPVPAFMDRQLDDARCEEAHFGGCGAAVFELDAFLQRRDDLLARRASHLGDVGLLDAVAGMREAVRELAVVRQEQRTRRIRVEAADRDDMRFLRDELDDGLASLRIADRRDDVGRLVQQQMRELLLRDPLPVDLDRVLALDDGVELPGLAVDEYAAGFDQLVGLAARRDACPGEIRVETHRMRR